jgi:hypothetical protein
MISGRANRVEVLRFFAVLVVASPCCMVPFADPNLCIDREARADRVVAGMART